MRIVAISDTHHKEREVSLPDGDILIFAGDMTIKGQYYDVMDFAYWLNSSEVGRKFEHILITPGNNDTCLDPKYNPLWSHYKTFLTYLRNVHYLIDESIVIEGKKFYLSPSARKFASPAFTLDSAAKARACWDKIPTDIDVLVTHGPAYGVLDISLAVTGNFPQGCPVLRDWIETYHPPIHIHGHIHSQHGIHKGMYTTTYNVSLSTNDLEDKPLENPPTIIEL